MGRAIALSFLLVVGCVLATACGPTLKQKTSSTAVLRIECKVPDAEVYLDSKYFREIAEMRAGVRLKPGEYRVEVRHSDYHSRYFEFTLEQNERKLLSVELAARLP